MRLCLANQSKTDGWRTACRDVLAMRSSPSSSHNVFLRDHCQCPACRHEITKQRLYDTYKVRKARCFASFSHLTAHVFRRFHLTSLRPWLSRPTAASRYRGKTVIRRMTLLSHGNGCFPTHTLHGCSKKQQMLKTSPKRHYGPTRLVPPLQQSHTTLS